jgi:NTP pyrophosphatase (non-canonical NTP hydrolase)
MEILIHGDDDQFVVYSGLLPRLATEVYENNVAKGFEPDPHRTFGDECALLHSEISELSDAYYRWGFSDATWAGEDGKPEGVGSELADIFIRLLHYSKVRGTRLHIEYQRQRTHHNAYPAGRVAVLSPFPMACNTLHSAVSKAFEAYRSWGMEDRTKSRFTPEGVHAEFGFLLLVIIRIAERYNINLNAEYRRKMDYNKTRSHRHGGKLL